MDNHKNEERLQETFEEMENVHYLPGPIYKMMNKYKALMFMDFNELQAIYHLVESHVPGLRYKTELRYNKVLSRETSQLPLAKQHVAIKCANIRVKDNITSLLEKLKEMPSEWTIVQLTSRFNPEDNIELDSEKLRTNPIHISVFDCGKQETVPFCVTIETPIDCVNGATVELTQEMHSIIKEYKTFLTASNRSYFKSIADKESFYNTRASLNERLKRLVKDTESMWLKGWRCLFIGKYVDSKLEVTIQNRISNYFATKFPNFKLTQRISKMLTYIVKGRCYMTLSEFKKVVQNCFSGPEPKDLVKNVCQFVNSLSEELNLIRKKKHPVILVVDETLDNFPWETMDVCFDQPISRVPSVHVLYALFKEHEATIKDGCKIINHPQNGSYVINPQRDLIKMENRISSFLSYWTPKWTGLRGTTPSETEFEKLLLSSDIFCYNGHGSGTEFLSMEKIEKLRVQAIVLLFGCGSISLQKLSPQVEMFGVDYVYLIACSPCVVGMLWTVTDNDTDIFTADLISYWVSSSAKVGWKYLDKSKWNKGEKVNFNDVTGKSEAQQQPNEPELLRALSFVKNSNSQNHFLNKAACVARGIPVKIDYT